MESNIEKTTLKKYIYSSTPKEQAVNRISSPCGSRILSGVCVSHFVAKFEYPLQGYNKNTQTFPHTSQGTLKDVEEAGELEKAGETVKAEGSKRNHHEPQVCVSPAEMSFAVFRLLKHY